MRVKKDSWNIVEKVLRRYPESKKEYDDELENLICSSPSHDGQPTSGAVGSRTESIALKLQSPHMQRLKREIEAVERVYNNLPQKQQKVIRIRYWSNPMKNIPYLKMRDIEYSEIQMKRIVHRVVCEIGIYLGELK